MRAITFALALPLLLMACAAPEGGGSSPLASPSPTGEPQDNGPVPANLFDAIVGDAAAKAGVDPSAFTVVEAAAVTWSDGSLGCPEPGMFYTQALVEGYRVVLEAAGVQYDYHASSRGGFSLCPPGRAKPPIDGGS